MDEPTQITSYLRTIFIFNGGGGVNRSNQEGYKQSTCMSGPVKQDVRALTIAKLIVALTAASASGRQLSGMCMSHGDTITFRYVRSIIIAKCQETRVFSKTPMVPYVYITGIASNQCQFVCLILSYKVNDRTTTDILLQIVKQK